MTNMVNVSLRSSFASGKTLPLSFRKQQLSQLACCLEDHTGELIAAMNGDFKSITEAKTELSYLKSECYHAIANLECWAKSTKVSVELANIVDSCYTMPQPYGVALVIGAWNYPLVLSLEPVIGAIAAGNCVALKTSEMAPKTASAISHLFSQYMDQSCYQVVEGGPEQATELLAQQWDYIFFTGSTGIGKIVYSKAATNLTPVTLELGGKSPCIVMDGNLKTIANRIVWGKCFNAGQTCVAPDYVMCKKELVKEFVEACEESITAMYGSDVKQSIDYARIVNERHVKRLQSLIESEKDNVAFGGKVDLAERFISPTIFTNIKLDSPLMKEEIFGPLMPIISIDSLEEAITHINSKEKPLALYAFTNNSKHVDLVLSKTSSGGTCINDVIMHMLAAHLPFGGVGASGIGAYHRKATFDTFSHSKSVMHRSQGFEFVNTNLRYAPSSETKTSLLSKVLFKTK